VPFSLRPLFLGLAITSGLLIPILLRLRSSVGEARAEKLVAGERYSQLKRSHGVLEEDLRFLTSS